MTLALSALIGGYEDQGDAATVTATPVDASGNPLASTALATATAAIAARRPRCCARLATGPVPRGTRTIVVRLASLRAGGDYNDGYVDNVSLTLHLAPLQVTAARVSGTVRVNRDTLTGAAEVPLGATIDARRGVVELTTQTGTARFSGGRFVVRRPTELRLSGRDRTSGRGRVPHRRPLQHDDRERPLAGPRDPRGHRHARHPRPRASPRQRTPPAAPVTRPRSGDR